LRAASSSARRAPSSAPSPLLLLARGAQPVDHLGDGTDLRAFLGGVVRPGVAPPVPAAARVVDPEVTCHDLRVEHDQAIGIGPAVIARVADEALADRFGSLPAAVEHD